MVVKDIRSEDGKHRLEIYENASGQFRFTVFVWAPSRDEIDGQHHGDGYWSVGPESGLYLSVRDAERDARAEHAWMREGLEE
jgi:hypothetical protein